MQTYTANLLNQYTNRTVPGFVESSGTADAAASITVNGAAASRKGDYFRGEVSVNCYELFSPSYFWPKCLLGRTAPKPPATNTAPSVNYSAPPRPPAKLNPFRLSTKFQDDKTGLPYYGHGDLCTAIGGWIGRD